MEQLSRQARLIRTPSIGHHDENGNEGSVRPSDIVTSTPNGRPSNDQWRPPDSRHEGLYENRWNEIAHRDGKWPSDYLSFGHSQKASMRWYKIK